MQDFLRLTHIDNVLPVAKWKTGALANVGATLDWMDQNHIHATLVGPAPCTDNGGSQWPELSDQEHFNELGSKIIASKVRDAHAGFGQ
jgi:hypothetical protein